MYVCLCWNPWGYGWEIQVGYDLLRMGEYLCNESQWLVPGTGENL